MRFFRKMRAFALVFAVLTVALGFAMLSAPKPADASRLCCYHGLHCRATDLLLGCLQTLPQIPVGFSTSASKIPGEQELLAQFFVTRLVASHRRATLLGPQE